MIICFIQYCLPMANNIKLEIKVMPLSIIWIQETLKTIRIMKNFTIIWTLKLSVLSHLCRRGHRAPQFSPTKSTTALQKLMEDFFHRLAAPCIVKKKPGECIHTIHVVQNSNIQITVTDTALESAADNCTAEVVHLRLSALLKRHHCTAHLST